MTGMLADENLVDFGSVDETGWSITMPAGNARRLPLSVRARSQTYGTPEAPVILRGRFEAREPVTYCGLFDTNLWQHERVRLELFRDADWTDLLYDSRSAVTGRDRRVVPSLFNWRQLRLGAPNFLRGGLTTKDALLYPTNVHMRVPLCRPKSWRWSIVGRGRAIDPENPRVPVNADYLELGLAWGSDSIEFELDYAMGEQNGWIPGDDITRTAGGGVWIEPGTGRRSTEIPIPYMTRRDGNRLHDQSVRVSWDRPVVWLPSRIPADGFRYGGLFRRVDGFRKERKTTRHDGAVIQLEEITR